MTVLSELKELSLSANAKEFASAQCSDLPSLVTHAELRVVELRVLLKQIAAVHRSSGSDTRTYAALTALIAELA